MCTRPRISTSHIHFIISKTVSAVWADATEVPTSRHKSSSTNGLAATGPKSGYKFLKKIFGKQFFRLHYDLKNTLNPLVKSVFKSVHNHGRYLQFCDCHVCSFQYAAMRLLQLHAWPILRTGLCPVQLFLVHKIFLLLVLVLVHKKIIIFIGILVLIHEGNTASWPGFTLKWLLKWCRCVRVRVCVCVCVWLLCLTSCCICNFRRTFLLTQMMTFSIKAQVQWLHHYSVYMLSQKCTLISSSSSSSSSSLEYGQTSTSWRLLTSGLWPHALPSLHLLIIIYWWYYLGH